MSIFVDEANGYYVGQVLPEGHAHAVSQVAAIRRTAEDGPFRDECGFRYNSDAEATEGTFVSWH